MTYQVGYYPHNIHFFVAAASMEGRQADALKAAEEVRAKVHAEMLRDPGDGRHGPAHAPDAALHEDPLRRCGTRPRRAGAAGQSAVHVSAMWHAARGLAHAAQGHVKEAEAERAAVAAVKDDPALKTAGVSSVNFASSIVAIAHEVLSGEIAGARSAAPIRQRVISRRRSRSRTI